MAKLDLTVEELAHLDCLIEADINEIEGAFDWEKSELGPEDWEFATEGALDMTAEYTLLEKIRSAASV